MDGAMAAEGMKEDALFTLNEEALGLKAVTFVFIPGAVVGGPDGTKTGAFWFKDSCAFVSFPADAG